MDQAVRDEHVASLVPAPPRSEADIPEESAIGETVPLSPERPGELMSQLGTIRLSKAQRAKLEKYRKATPEVTSIKPTGEVYVSAVHYRAAMNDIFGPLQWALRPMEPEKMDLRDKGQRGQQGNGSPASIMYQRTALVVNGRVVGQAIGECPYHPNNSRMTFGDAAAGVQSNALMRLCKPIGIYENCWDARYGEQFRREHCVQVWLDNKKKRYGDDEESNRPVWRRLDQEPFYNERDITDTSPNKRRWEQQRSARMRDTAGFGASDDVDDTGDARREAPAPTPAASRVKPERVLACKEVNGGFWCVRGEVSGDCYTDDFGTFSAARAACTSRSEVILDTETRKNRKNVAYRYIVELLPPRAAADDDAAAAGAGPTLFDE